MEMGLLHDYFGNFSMRGERYYFMQGEIKPTRGEIETNIGKLSNSEKLKFPFWVEVMIFDRVGVGAGGGWQGAWVPDGGGGSEGPDQVGREQLGA